MLIYAVRSEIHAAWYAALITVALTPLLYKTNARLSTLVMGGLAALYLLYLVAVWDIGYEIEADGAAMAMPQFVVPFARFLWVMAFTAVFPQVQLVRLGAAGIGRFRGDFQVRLFGSFVPVALASSVLLVCSVHAVTQVWAALQWAGRLVSS
ncbi:MAG TPA: hypothetical protein VF655_13790 [Allosphingosinicella sp.]|jgi:hypothetical protein